MSLMAVFRLVWIPSRTICRWPAKREPAELSSISGALGQIEVIAPKKKQKRVVAATDGRPKTV